MLGKGSRKIEIRAIGIVKEVDPEDKRVYVKWILCDMKRPIESKGCFQSIHGPYSANDPWIANAFHI